MTVPLATTFEAGERAAGRFRIVRYLASGGMGEVYEAVDELLNVSVALKTLRAHVADDPLALERFRREILFARQVTHPNVCRIFDVFQHGRPPQASVTFLTMELLSGETLAERLRRSGPMDTATALPIVGQMVSALSAAHRAGVLHRDVKSGNVMLVAGAGAERVVITDFGLARPADPHDASSSPGPMIGTSAYMAPEQVSGGVITPAADIYALGVVLYEMVTGTRPFTGDTPAATALRRLTEVPASPASVVPGLDGMWERAILRCLERDPARRFATADQLLSSLTPTTAPTRRRLSSRVVGVAAGAAAIVAAGLIGHDWSGVRTPASDVSRPPEANAPPRRAIAVLGFKNLSGRPDSAWLSAAFAEMLATELSASSQLRTIPGEKVARMRIDFALPETEALAGETVQRIHANLGAELLVLGSYLAVAPQPGGPIRLDLRVQDTLAGETVTSLAETGTEAEILDLVARCGRRLREALGVDPGPALSGSELRRRSLPSTPEAVRLYTQGLAKLRAFDAPGASEVLAQAIAADPSFPMARLALSEAWTAQGYEAKARDEAQRAFDASLDLSREERLAVEARYRETTLERGRAIEIYRVLFGFFPDDVEYGLRLARCQIDAGSRADAQSVLDQLRQLQLTTGELARVDLTEAGVAQLASNYRSERELAARAAARAELVGARLLAAAARDLGAWALLRLGKPDLALAEYELARRGFEIAGDRSGMAHVISSVGLILRRRGDIVRARQHHTQALALFREVGDRSGAAWTLNHLGMVAEIEGDPTAARAAFEESLATFREIRSDQGSVLSQLRLAAAAWQAGDLAAAQAGYAEALDTSRKLGARAHEARALRGLGDVLAARGDLVAARQRYEESLRLHEPSSEPVSSAETWLSISALDLAEGRTERCLTNARKAAAAFEQAGAADLAASAHVLLAQALLAQQRTDEADRELREARRWAGDSPHPRTRLRSEIAEAGVAAARGGLSGSRTNLERVVREADRAQLPAVALEAALMLGHLEALAGARTQAVARWLDVQKRATSRGLGQIAREAAAALSVP